MPPKSRKQSFAKSFLPRFEELEKRDMPAVAINANELGRLVNDHTVGVNVASYDYFVSADQENAKGVTPDARTLQMIKEAGLRFLRFSNGSGADEWHWARSDNQFPVGAALLANLAVGAGADAMVDINFGTGTPQEAAAYVAYLNGSVDNNTALGVDANGTNWQTVAFWATLRGQNALANDDGLNFLRAGHAASYSFKHFEIGNEVYFQAYLPENQRIATKFAFGTQAYLDAFNQFAQQYVNFTVQFANLANQVDPSIRIGLGVGNPGEYDDQWNVPVLQKCKNQGFTPEFLSDHFYVYDGNLETLSDSALLHNTVNDPNSVNPFHGFGPRNWAGRASSYRAILTQHLGQEGSKVELICAEFNSDADAANKQSTSLVKGLFIADALGGILSTEYQGVVYWNLRNDYANLPNNANLYGWRPGADEGMLGSSGPAPFTGPYVPYPVYFAEQLASKLVKSGGKVVPVQSDSPDLGVYAVKQANGHLTLLVINKSANQNLNKTFNISGFTPASQATLWQYGKGEDEAQHQSADGAASLTQTTPNLAVNGGQFSLTFPSYTMSVLDLAPADGQQATRTTLTKVADSGVGSAGTEPQLLAAGSFNPNVDSIKDLAITNRDGTISILLGNGDGTFQPGIKFFVPGVVGPEGIVAGNFDGDNVADLAVASNGGGNTPGAVTILHGNGDGTFTKKSSLDLANIKVNGQPLANSVLPTYLATDDLDKDGKPDLVVADFNNPQVYVFLGQGDGTFTFNDTNFNPNGVNGAEQIVITDFNGDGNLDIAVANKNDGSVSYFKGFGDGNITAVDNFKLQVDTGSIGLAATDLDGDGKKDLVIANYGTDAQGAHRVNILLNTSAGGDISFADPGVPGRIDVGDHLLNVVIDDFDGDGRADIAVTSAGNTVDPNAPTDNSIWVLFNKGQAIGEVNFPVPANPLTAGLNPVGLIGADVNGDGRLDLISANQSSSTVSVFLKQLVEPAEKQDTTTVIAAPAQAAFGQPVTLTATVTAAAGAMTGTVTFFDGGNVIGAANVVNGVATLTTSALKVGRHAIVARYNGDDNFNGSSLSDAQALKITGKVTGLRIVRSAITLDRTSKRAVQTITLTNATQNVLPLPLTLRFGTLTAMVAGTAWKIGVIGQTGMAGRDPLLSVNTAAGATELPPGQSLKVKVTYNIRSTTQIKYQLSVLFA